MNSKDASGTTNLPRLPALQPPATEEQFFPGFTASSLNVNGCAIRVLRGGSGPALLLLHGYPQTHVIWHKIAPELAKRYTVVATDLRGYGDSEKPRGNEDDHSAYSFRTMAEDQVEVMRRLGFESFLLAGHDRGARVAHRLALDYPERVRKLCLLDIVPTLTMYRETNQAFATKYMWWFFLIQPAPLPEHMIGLDPDFFLGKHFGVQNGTPGALTPEALAEYRRCFCCEETIHATCEDYRAAAGIDLEMDEADDRNGNKVQAPLHVLWGAKGAVGKLWDVLAAWRVKAAAPVSGRSLDSGHYLAEEQPEEVLKDLLEFFA